MGFRDTIAWGVIPGAPTQTAHASHANSGTWCERTEDQEEYKRRCASPGGNREPFGRIIREYRVESLCMTYRSELAWVAARKPQRVTVYMAHPVSGPDFADNVINATIWFRFLRRQSASALSELTGVHYDSKPLILCPWLAGIEEDELSPGGREGVLQDCLDTVRLFDEVWMVWKRTEGMTMEAAAAATVRDLTHLGRLPPVPQRDDAVRATLSLSKRKKRN